MPGTATISWIRQSAGGSGNTINAASAEYGDVSDALTDASDGDTILIPADTATWTTALEVTKGVTIKGAGVGSTVITDNVAKSSSAGSSALFYFNVASPKVWQLLDIGIVGQATDGSSNQPGHIRIGGNSKGWNVGRVNITNQQTVGVRIIGDTYGCIYGGSFSGSFKQGVIIEHSDWGGVGDYGDNSWAQPTNLGSEEAVYIEDMTFSGDTDAAFFAGAFDGEAGARLVFRYNTLVDQNTTSHGIETGSNRRRSMRYCEVYNNTVTLILADYFHMIRGGTGVAFNNTWNGECNSHLKFTHYNNSGEQPSAFFGATDGSNAWDQNTSGEGGWLALDQIGAGEGDYINGASPAWPNQAREPYYCWSNTLGTGSYANTWNPPIEADRDFFLDTGSYMDTGLLSARPGSGTLAYQGYWATDTNTLYVWNGSSWVTWYQPYTYPHPNRDDA